MLSDCLREGGSVERIDLTRLRDHHVRNEVHRAKKLQRGLLVICNIYFPRMNRVVPDDADEIKRLLYFDGQPFPYQASNIIIDVFALFPELLTEFLNTES